MQMQEDEEVLRLKLEGIERELNRPTQYKGRLNELKWQIHMQVQSQNNISVNKSSYVCIRACVCVCRTRH